MRTRQHLTQTGCRLLLPVLWWLATVSTATAEQFGDFTYEINSPDTNTVTITDYSGAGGTVVIPSNIVGKSVTIIGDFSFFNCDSIAHVVFPESITTIGKNAFYKCDGLTGVTIPANVHTIRIGAFEHCSNLAAILVDAGNPVYSSGGGVLFDKGHTTLIQCPGGKAGDYSIPGSVATIANEAFGFCSGLTDLVIPDSVTTIGSKAFWGCHSLTNLLVGEEVTSIGSQAFGYCYGLISITVDAANAVHCSIDGVLLSEDQTRLIQCPGGKPGSYTLPDTVITITGSAFRYCQALTDVTIFGNNTTIGGSAFSACPNLSSISILGNVTTIGFQAFGYCASLTNAMLLGTVTSIEGSAFSSCSSLRTITLPDSVTSIGKWAFRGCSVLTNVYFAGDAPVLGSEVFRDSPPTIYYLAGTTGWGPTFGGRPTAVWMLPELTDISVAGSPGNPVVLSLTGTPPDMPVVVRACTNLVDSDWVEVGTATLVDGTNTVTDTNSTSFPNRIYCVMPR